MSAIYIHIPFCQIICPFCAFSVLPDDRDKHDLYVRLIQKELDLIPENIKKSMLLVRSVYFGGGTPSRLAIRYIGILVKWIRQSFSVASNAHWSIELNPEDVSLPYLKALKAIGFTRISLGVQSFNDLHLNKLGRVHDAESSNKATDAIIDAGFKDINLDLMYGFPGQTIETLKADLNQFVAKKVTHISAYGLDIEEKSKLNRKKDWKVWQRDNEILITQMYETIVHYLSLNGYEQYEISNFSIPGYSSLQNDLNWGGNNYLGLGMGAHSYVHPYRWANNKRWVDYKNALNRNQLPRDFYEKLSKTQQRDETIMVQTRLSSGLNMEAFSAKYSINIEKIWKQKLKQLIDNHLISKNNNTIKLTSKGMMLADEVASSLAALIPE